VCACVLAQRRWQATSVGRSAECRWQAMPWAIALWLRGLGEAGRCVCVLAPCRRQATLVGRSAECRWQAMPWAMALWPRGLGEAGRCVCVFVDLACSLLKFNPAAYLNTHWIGTGSTTNVGIPLYVHRRVCYLSLSLYVCIYRRLGESVQVIPNECKWILIACVCASDERGFILVVITTCLCQPCCLM
jgi:hypothetical protein